MIRLKADVWSPGLQVSQAAPMQNQKGEGRQGGQTEKTLTWKNTENTPRASTVSLLESALLATHMFSRINLNHGDIQ